MHRLQEFLTYVLDPQVNRYESSVVIDVEPGKKSSVDPGRTLSVAEVFESFLWLHLGTEIGSFPQPASNDVYENSLTPFFKSLLSRDPGQIENMQGQKIYVAHSQQSAALLPLLGRFATVLFEKAMRQEDVFSTESTRFSNPERLKPVFQTFLLLHTMLLSRRSLASFTYYVSFADKLSWRKAWNTSCTPEEVMRADTQQGTAPSALICSGLLNLWNYVTKIQSVIRGLKEDASLSSDLFRLTDRLKEMDRWRINLKSRDTADRFEDVRARIMEAVETESERDRVSRVCAREIRDSMDSAFSFWFSAAPAGILEPA